MSGDPIPCAFLSRPVFLHFSLLFWLRRTSMSQLCAPSAQSVATAHTVFEIDSPLSRKSWISSWHHFHMLRRFPFRAALGHKRRAFRGVATARRRSSRQVLSEELYWLAVSARGLRPDADVDAEWLTFRKSCATFTTPIKTPRQSIGGLLNGQARP